MDILQNTLTKKLVVRVISLRHLTPHAFVIRMERNGLAFRAGQYITIGLPGVQKRREYSIYSSEQEDHLEILAMGVPPGSFGHQLQQLSAGAHIEIEGPSGTFVIPQEKIKKGKFVFVATGTGISPFHSFIGSYPGLDYFILHGIRHAEEAYERSCFDPERYLSCTTRDNKGDFHGRVTQYLREHPSATGAEYYFCGNSSMIRDAMEVLGSKGVGSESFHAEVYF